MKILNSCPSSTTISYSAMCVQLIVVQLIKGCVYYFCGSVWPSVEGGHVAKKESFQFCFSCKISINVTLEPRHYSVLARLFLVGNSPFLVLLEWGKLYLEFVWTCCQKRIFSVLFLLQNFHECNLRAAPLLSTSQTVLGWKFTLFGALGMGEVVWTCCQKRIFSVLFLLQNFRA